MVKESWCQQMGAEAYQLHNHYLHRQEHLQEMVKNVVDESDQVTPADRLLENVKNLLSRL